MAGKLKGNIDGNGFDKNPQNINRKGRPEKFISTLKAQGYSKSEVTDCILVLYSMKLNELTEIASGKYEGKESTILEITCARAILKDAKNGDTKNLDMLLNRSLGSPKTEVDNNINFPNALPPVIFQTKK